MKTNTSEDLPSETGVKKLFPKFVHVLSVVFFSAASILIFYLFTRLCFKITLSYFDVFEDTGFVFVAPQRPFSSDSPLKALPRKIARSYVNFFFPEARNLPFKFYHPVIQLQKNPNPSAYFKKPEGSYVRHPTMVPTPYIMYAPAVGFRGGAYHNAQQFRYREDLGKKPAREIRIFIIGGSAAWGSFAPDGESTIAGFLEKELNEWGWKGITFRVINAAAGGWNSTDERTWILNRISEYEPDMILSYSGFNDIFHTFRNQLDLFSNFHIDASYYYWAIKEYEKYNRGEAVAQAMEKFGGSYRPEDFPRKTIKNIQMIARYLETMGCKYVYVLQPLNRALQNTPTLRDPYKILAHGLRRRQKEMNFKFVNYLNFFDGREQLFIDDCHVGDIGNQMIAKSLSVELKPLIEEIAQSRVSAGPPS